MIQEMREVHRVTGLVAGWLEGPSRQHLPTPRSSMTPVQDQRSMMIPVARHSANDPTAKNREVVAAYCFPQTVTGDDRSHQSTLDVATA